MGRHDSLVMAREYPPPSRRSSNEPQQILKTAGRRILTFPVGPSRPPGPALSAPGAGGVPGSHGALFLLVHPPAGCVRSGGRRAYAAAAGVAGRTPSASPSPVAPPFPSNARCADSAGAHRAARYAMAGARTLPEWLTPPCPPALRHFPPPTFPASRWGVQDRRKSGRGPRRSKGPSGTAGVAAIAAGRSWRSPPGSRLRRRATRSRPAGRRPGAPRVSRCAAAGPRPGGRRCGCRRRPSSAARARTGRRSRGR